MNSQEAAGVLDVARSLLERKPVVAEKVAGVMDVLLAIDPHMSGKARALAQDATLITIALEVLRKHDMTFDPTVRQQP